MTNYRDKIIELIKSQPQHVRGIDRIRISEDIEYDGDKEEHTVSVFNLFNYTFRETYYKTKEDRYYDINNQYAKLWAGIQDYLKYYSKGEKPPHVLAAERYMNNVITNNADSRGEYIH